MRNSENANLDDSHNIENRLRNKNRINNKKQINKEYRVKNTEITGFNDDTIGNISMNNELMKNKIVSKTEKKTM